MPIKDTIIRVVAENAFASAPVTEQSDLYADLRFDSLGFIDLLAQIEDMYSIAFDIAEMESCIQVGKLITAVENKLKERDGKDD